MSPCLRVSVSPCLLALAVGVLFCSKAPAQDREPPTLAVSGVSPGGARISATESWGTYDFLVANLTDTDRQARVLMFFADREDVQYGRDVWVPARSTLSSWMLVGPASGQPTSVARDIRILLYDRTDGKETIILPGGEEKTRPRSVLYRKREPYTAIVHDEADPEEPVFGQLPRPASRSEEASTFARIFRHARNLSELLPEIYPGALPPMPEALDGVDHLILASGRMAKDPAGMRALRQWLQRGGRVWVMLDLVEPDAVASLLGDAYDFQVVDRVSLTTFRIEPPATAQRLAQPQLQEHDRPVDFVRVILPHQERVRYSVNGWPAWFSRQVGRGKVVFTTLGARAWSRPRGRGDGPSPFEHFPSLPIAMEPLEGMAAELDSVKEADPVRADAFRRLVTDEIGYSVVGRGTVGLVFGAALLAALGLGLALRKSRRPELLGWLGPAAALGAAAVFVGLGEASRRAAPPTLAVAQVVDAVAGTEEVPVQGLLAVYRPDSGAAELGAERGGLFELDMTGVEGQTRRLVLTDTDSWRWENLALPAGVRQAPFRSTVPTGEPITAVARFGPEGLEGKLAAGPFRDVTDVLLSTPNGRNLAVRTRADGTFSAGGTDVLPPGQFLASAVLSDLQQRRQELYREFLKPSVAARLEGRNVLYAWAKPIDLHFLLAPEARTAGSALLTVPLRLVRSGPGERVTIPGPLIACRRIMDRGSITRPTREGKHAIDMHLHFQLPDVVLPLKIERARLLTKIDAPTRRVILAARAEGRPVELHRVESPLDPIRLDITEERFLRLDEDGGLHVHVSVSDLLRPSGTGQPDVGDETWTIEYLELEVSGRVEG